MGKIITKLYLYDSSQEANNYRGTDYSQYILLGDSDCDNLDDTLDTAEVTLAGLPFREEFAPTTKFILEKWQLENDEQGNPVEVLYKNLHLEVSTDAVEQPIMSDDTYFNHCITFIEASVEAQTRLVDDMAVTYKLKDVTLESTPTYNVDALATKTQTDVERFPSENFGTSSGFYNWATRRIGHSFKWVMPTWYQVTINGESKTPSWSDWTSLKLYQEIPSGQQSAQVSLPVPMLECSSAVANTKTFTHNGYCSLEVLVVETNIATTAQTTVLQMDVNPNRTDVNEGWTADSMLPSLNYGWIESRPFATVKASSTPSGVEGSFLHRVTQVAEPTTSTTNRVITFTIKPNCSYKVQIRRKELDPKDTSGCGIVTGFTSYEQEYDKQPAYYAYSSYTSYYLWLDKQNEDAKINANYPLLTLDFNAVQAGQGYSIYLKNAPDATALNLFNKALLSSQNTMKQSGVIVDETPTSFYLEENDENELRNTILVENFYNQKNLWEVLMDIGKYIHARPQIRFGTDNRLVVTWKRYGRTDQFTDYANNISIYNSRFVEEYISSLSSYITNMVQLGGSITETIAPKSSSDDYLVYNDVAEIVTEKNIIELVQLEVIRKSDGEIRDITDYTFEESVYNILSINANDSVNKGLAIYYKLGTNKIVGLNYRLPVVNSGDPEGDYSIKKIIATAYNASSWSSIMVNDYLFRVTYRTKDTLRSDQTRPDLRKYLLSTKYDRIPQHNQFNNQTDVVVDSEKFGHNIYGKLIRTGNTVYTKLEWVDGLPSLKRSGDLYKIGDELYYVAKVTNTYYEDHIESEVEFSKDFNRLSQIIGIPSEPRFYEISERNIVDREIAIDDFIKLGTFNSATHKVKWGKDSFISVGGWNNIQDWLINPSRVGSGYPNYAITVFKNDIDKPTVAGNEEFIVETCHPVNTYAVENTLSIEWDLQDNFSAGDQVSNTTTGTSTDTAYKTLLPYRYCDVYGRCDMIDFALMPLNFNFDYDPSQYLPSVITELRRETVEKVQALPQSPVNLSGINQRYIGTYEGLTTPTEQELNDFFEQQMGQGETPQAGDYIYYKSTKYTYAVGETSPAITSGWRASGTSAPFCSADGIYVTLDGEKTIDQLTDNDVVINFKENVDDYKSHEHGLIVLKDCRETLKFNYNLQLLSDSDRFVISSNVWDTNKGLLKIGLLKTEINKLANSTIKNEDFAIDNISYTVSASTSGDLTYPYRVININTAIWSYAQNNNMTVAEVMDGVKAIVLYDTTEINNYDVSGAKRFVFGRNIDGLSVEEATKDWVIEHIEREDFQKQ